MPMPRFGTPALLLALIALVVAGCAKVEIPAPHQAPLSTATLMLLGKKGMTPGQPIFVRIFKAESELEVWKQRDDGHFHLFKTYPICHWSGGLGPKYQQGDKQSPEGFYRVNRHQMNPNSSFHLSFDLGFPNAYDRANGRTGSFLMVHGKCKSAGCYAMTDGLIEEIYALAREAFAGGQKAFEVHAFPFRMTEQNLARYQGDRNSRFWQSLRQGYDYFEVTRKTPNIEVCARRYHVNVEWDGRRLDPEGACPRFRHGPVVAYVPGTGGAGAPTQGLAGPAAAVAPGAPGPATSAPVAPAPRPVAADKIRYYSGQQPMSLAPRAPPHNDPIAAVLQK